MRLTLKTFKATCDLLFTNIEHMEELTLGKIVSIDGGFIVRRHTPAAPDNRPQYEFLISAKNDYIQVIKNNSELNDNDLMPAKLRVKARQIIEDVVKCLEMLKEKFILYPKGLEKGKEFLSECKNIFMPQSKRLEKDKKTIPVSTTTLFSTSRKQNNKRPSNHAEVSVETKKIRI